MKVQKTLLMMLLLAVTGCGLQKTHPLQSKQAASGDWTLPYGEWGFSFIVPLELTADVTHARVIDTDGYLYIFNTLDSTPEDPNSVGKWSENVFGGGVQFNKVKKPPQYIVFCWDSLIDRKTYETSALFSPVTWQRMKTPASHTLRSGDPSWYDNMLFGLAPGGKVRIWLPDIGGRPSLPVTPLKQHTRSGNDLTVCKNYVRPADSYHDIKAIQDFIKGKTYPYGEW